MNKYKSFYNDAKVVLSKLLVENSEPAIIQTLDKLLNLISPKTALNKEVATRQGTIEDYDVIVGDCPNCGCSLDEYESFCHYCGQNINWGNEDIKTDNLTTKQWLHKFFDDSPYPEVAELVETPLFKDVFNELGKIEEVDDLQARYENLQLKYDELYKGQFEHKYNMQKLTSEKYQKKYEELKSILDEYNVDESNIRKILLTGQMFAKEDK